jgi:molecular chaperone DnaJ
VVTCTTCHGHGVVQMRQGFFSVQQTCPQCKGTRQADSRTLRDLPRRGQDQEQQDAGSQDPAGIDDGMRIRSTGNGEPGTNGGPPGDLYIEIRLKKHDIFERDGDDLHCAVPISFTTAALGGEIEVPTLAGKAAIDIPEGTQAAKQFRLRGKGIKGVRSSYPGDLYCHITVETPVKLTEHQRKLLKELDESLKKGGAKHFFRCAINQTVDRTLLKEGGRFIEPTGSIGDAFPGKTEKRQMAIRHRCFHPERIKKASF